MAFRLVKQGGKLDYNYKEYFLDTESDLASVPTIDAYPGSIAYVIDSGKLFILNTNKEWKEQ